MRSLRSFYWQWPNLFSGSFRATQKSLELVGYFCHAALGAASRNLGRDSGQISPLDVVRFDNPVEGTTINPVLRCNSWTFLAVNCPKRFQSALLTET